MSTEYKWHFGPIELYDTKNELSNVIKTLHWQLRAIPDVGKPAQKADVVELSEPTVDTFTDYNDLTAEALKKWALLDAAAKRYVPASKGNADEDIPNIEEKSYTAEQMEILLKEELDAKILKRNPTNISVMKSFS